MSRDHGTASSPRCLLVWTLATLAALGLTGVTLPGLAATWASLVGGGRPAPPFDQLLVRACEVALLLCAAWLWLATSLVVGDALRGRACRRHRGVPDPVRRVVLAACGAALGGLLVPPGYAAPATADRPGPSVLHGLPLPDRATTVTYIGRLVRQAQADAATTDTPARRRPLTVGRGDTLWEIARDSLPPGSGDAEVDRRWRSIHALNREVIGPDPDLIHPGQQLRLPPPPNRP